MDIWRKIGIAEASVGDLGDEARGLLLGSRDPEAGTPLLLEPGSLEDLVVYLLELESPDRGGCGYAKLRNALLASAMELETAGGERVVALAEPVDRFVRERISGFMRQDRRDLLTLGSELGHASQTLSGDGHVLTSASSAEASWARAANAVGSFLARPRRAARFDLEDFFMSVDGICALANCVVLFRRLLLAAGLALDGLGRATLGAPRHLGHRWRRRPLEGIRRDCSAATGEVPCGAGVQDPGTVGTRGDWLRPSRNRGNRPDRVLLAARAGRASMGVRPGQATMNFAGVVGVVWPGPGIYGYDDGEEEPGRARALCAAIESRRDPEHPITV